MVILLLLPQLLSPSFFLQEGEKKGKKKKKQDVFDYSYTAGSSLKMGGWGGGGLLFVDRHDIAYWL